MVPCPGSAPVAPCGFVPEEQGHRFKSAGSGRSIDYITQAKTAQLRIGHDLQSGVCI